MRYDILITMKTVKATITSKNQLTIPIKYVRNLGLDTTRQVTVTQRGGKLIITPLVTDINSKLDQIWGEFAQDRLGECQPQQSTELSQSAQAYKDRSTGKPYL